MAAIIRFFILTLGLWLTEGWLCAEPLKNISYADNTNPRQTLDLYLPAQKPAPLVVWIHGGGWNAGAKTDVLVPYLLAKGYAIASVEYRFSAEAVFPAQIQDCNAALTFLVKNAEKYGFDKARIAVGGDSAGGHLALLLALARNEAEFHADPAIHPRAVLDFYGPSDFTAIASAGAAGNPQAKNVTGIVTQLLGASPLERPDLARAASPLTYVTAGNPPVLMLQGEKDDVVPASQSKLLEATLKEAGVKSELVLIPDASHGGPLFFTAAVQDKVIRFLQENLAVQP